jgi:putative hydrolase of the HAD superfamily
LRDFAAACGVPAATVDVVAGDIVGLTDGFAWTHVGPGVAGALREIAALGLPVGIVSNSTGQVEQALDRLNVCYAPTGAAPARDADSDAGSGAQGINVGVVIDSAVVGVSKPDPQIFALALAALGLSDVDRSTVVHVGDSLRYDVAGALAAGVRPLHLDPYGFCPAPDGHEHIRRLADVAALASVAR